MRKILAIIAALSITITSASAHACVTVIAALAAMVAAAATTTGAVIATRKPNNYPTASDKYCAYEYLKGTIWKCRNWTSEVRVMQFKSSDYMVTIKEQLDIPIDENGPLADKISLSPLRSYLFEVEGPGFPASELEGKTLKKVIQVWSDEDSDWRDIEGGYGEFFYETGEFDDLGEDIFEEFSLEGSVSQMRRTKFRVGIMYTTKLDCPKVGTRNCARKPHYIFTPSISVADCFDSSYFTGDEYDLIQPQVCGEVAAEDDVEDVLDE